MLFSHIVELKCVEPNLVDLKAKVSLLTTLYLSEMVCIREIQISDGQSAYFII